MRWSSSISSFFSAAYCASASSVASFEISTLLLSAASCADRLLRGREVLDRLGRGERRHHEWTGARQHRARDAAGRREGRAEGQEREHLIPCRGKRREIASRAMVHTLLAAREAARGVVNGLLEYQCFARAAISYAAIPHSRCSSGPTTRPRSRRSRRTTPRASRPASSRARGGGGSCAARHADISLAHYGVGKRGAAPLAASLRLAGQLVAPRPERQRARRRGRRGGAPRPRDGGGPSLATLDLSQNQAGPDGAAALGELLSDARAAPALRRLQHQRDRRQGRGGGGGGARGGRPPRRARTRVQRDRLGGRRRAFRCAARQLHAAGAAARLEPVHRRGAGDRRHALRDNGSLTLLSLGWNGLSDAGCMAIAAAVAGGAGALKEPASGATAYPRAAPPPSAARCPTSRRSTSPATCSVPRARRRCSRRRRRRATAVAAAPSSPTRRASAPTRRLRGCRGGGRRRRRARRRRAPGGGRRRRRRARRRERGGARGAQPADGAPRRLKKGAKKGGGEKAARKPLEAAPSTSAPANAPDAAPPAQEKDAPWRRGSGHRSEI